MKLYYSPGACSLASRITAEEIGVKLDYERVDLKSHRTESQRDYYAVNPKGAVPAIQLDDGGILTENVAILPFLADLKPEVGLAPEPGTLDRSRLMEWLGFLSSEVHKSFGPLFHGDDAERAMEAREKIERLLGFVDLRMERRDYLMGTRFTVADAYLFVMLLWCDKMDIPLNKMPNLESLKKRVAARAGVRAAMSAEGLKPPA